MLMENFRQPMFFIAKKTDVPDSLSGDLNSLKIRRHENGRRNGEVTEFPDPTAG
jgi:hypothetical protein